MKDGNYESPEMKLSMKVELQEALEDVSGLESRLEQVPFLETELSSQQTGVQSRLISDEGKLTMKAGKLMNRSKFGMKKDNVGT